METVNTVSSSPSVRQEGQAFPVNVGGPTNGFPHDVPSHANPKTAAPISMSRDSLGVPSILPTSNMTNPSTLTGGEGVQPMLLNGIDLPKSSALSSLAGVQTAEGKRQREREKRIMPARLQRVSNLLAGSTIEDELSGTNAKQGEIQTALLRDAQPLLIIILFLSHFLQRLTYCHQRQK